MGRGILIQLNSLMDGSSPFRSILADMVGRGAVAAHEHHGLKYADTSN